MCWGVDLSTMDDMKLWIRLLSTIKQADKNDEDWKTVCLFLSSKTQEGRVFMWRMKVWFVDAELDPS